MAFAVVLNQRTVSVCAGLCHHNPAPATRLAASPPEQELIAVTLDGTVTGKQKTWKA
jgi:hypothetical protein